METNTGVSKIAFSTICRAAVTFLGSTQVGATNSARSFSIYWQLFDFFSAALLISCNIGMGTGKEWSGTRFLLSGWIELMTLSMKVVPSNIGAATLFMMPNFARVRVPPYQRWSIIVPETANFMLDARQILGMSHWQMLSSQVRSKTSVRPRTGPMPASKTQINGRIRDEHSSKDTETL